MSVHLGDGIFQSFYQKLCEKSSLFQSREVKLLLSGQGFNAQELPQKVFQMFEIARNILKSDPRLQAQDLEPPGRYANFLDEMLNQAEWLEETRRALELDRRTYTQWLVNLSKSYSDVLQIPTVFRTHELCLAALKKFILPPDWVPADILAKYPDLHRFF